MRTEVKTQKELQAEMDAAFEQCLLQGDVLGLARQIQTRVNRAWRDPDERHVALTFRHRRGHRRGLRAEPREIYTYYAPEDMKDRRRGVDLEIAEVTAEALIRDMRKDRFRCPRCTRKSVGVAGWVRDRLLLTCGCHIHRHLYFEGIIEV